MIERLDIPLGEDNPLTTEIQAAFANTKLKYLEKWNARCHEIATIYKNNLIGIETPVDQEWEYCVYHNFVIKTINRDLMMQYLKENGVDTRVHYPIPIHLQNAAKELGYKNGDFPNTEIFSKTMISLPIYPELTDEEVYYVVEKVNSFNSK